MVSSEVGAAGCSLTVAFDSASVSKVHQAFTDADRLTDWWSEGAETDPRPGGGLHVWWEAMGWHLRGTYERVEPERITFTWKWDHEDLPARLVDLSFVEDGDATRVVLEHSAGSLEEAQSYLDGWLHFLPQLAEHVSSSPPS